MRIFLASIGLPRDRSSIPSFEALAAADRGGRHELVATADEADVVLFTECHLVGTDWTMRVIRTTAEFERHRSKVLVYDERDLPWCSFPGLYVSMPMSRFRTRYQLPWCYYATPDVLAKSGLAARKGGRARPVVQPGRVRFPSVPRPALRAGSTREPSWSESRASRSTTRVRPTSRPSSSASPRPCCAPSSCCATRSGHVVDTYERDDGGRALPGDHRRRLGAAARNRLLGVRVRWPEGSTEGLVEFLERHEPDAAVLGFRAREVFEERMSADVMFGRLGDALCDLISTRPWDRFPTVGFPDRNQALNAAYGVRGRLVAAKNHLARS